MQKKRYIQRTPPPVPLAITPTFRPWTHTSDDSYIYQLSLVVATATVSLIVAVDLLLTYTYIPYFIYLQVSRIHVYIYTWFQASEYIYVLVCYEVQVNGEPGQEDHNSLRPTSIWRYRSV